jgi:uncharacterized protein with HEPN domain
MNPNHDLVSLGHIKTSGEAILDHVAGYTRERFEENRKTRSAVLYEFVIVGEAVKRLSDATILAHPEIPWSRLAGMRDRLVHAFHRVDYEIVWGAAEKHIPALIELITKMIAQETNP